MRIRELAYLSKRLSTSRNPAPVEAHLELTYRCNFSCVHCYCKGSENKARELSARRWKEILDQLHDAGCLWLSFSGGEALIRTDFADIYSHAKKKGFLITLLTNGLAFNSRIMRLFKQSPPHAIEITINGITAGTFERITGRPGSFRQVMQNLRRLKKEGLPFYIKANCLTLNKDEIVRIKRWVEGFIGKKSAGRCCFTFDPVILPRLNGDTRPCKYRLSPQELVKIYRQDPEIWEEYRQFLGCAFPRLGRPAPALYQCVSWKSSCVIDPFGALKICPFTDRFSSDLSRTAFSEGFYNVFPLLESERFTTASRCRDCSLRPICHTCPAKAYLETGDREKPVDYFCKLAQFTLEQDKAFQYGKKIV